MGIVRKVLTSLAPLLAILSSWEVGVRYEWLNAFLLPAPSTVIKALLELAVSGQLAADVANSMLRVVAGFAAAVVFGTSLGLGLALSRTLSAALGPIVQLLRPIPPIAWIPLAILWFGLGGAPSYFLTMIGAIFPIVLNTYHGVRAINANFLNVARAFEASRAKTFLQVIWPAALPQILTGYRIGFGVAWMSLVGAEMLAVQSGLGYLIHVSQDLLKTDRVIAGMAMIGVIGVVCDGLLHTLEQRLCPWFAPSQEQQP